MTKCEWENLGFNSYRFDANNGEVHILLRFREYSKAGTSWCWNCPRLGVSDMRLNADTLEDAKREAVREFAERVELCNEALEDIRKTLPKKQFVFHAGVDGKSIPKFSVFAVDEQDAFEQAGRLLRLDKCSAYHLALKDNDELLVE